MATVTIESLRRDGKYMVRFEYPGAPNAFGGHYPARIYRHLLTADRLVAELVRNSTATVAHWGPAASLQTRVETERAATKAAADAALANANALPGA